jgi:ABC-type branched-subunit amino acid transport system ATPase component/ABC-type branched-subunit amino acid transport system permease subunit
VAAGLVGAALSLPIGLIGLRRLRADYQAMIMLVVSLIATNVAESQVKLFNGASGLSLIPQPLEAQLNLSQGDYLWFYVGLTAVFALLTFLVVQRISNSPLGRTLRSMRDNENAALSVGKDVTALRLLAFMVGGAIAGVSGALLVGFIGAWSPTSWLYPETFVYLGAVLVGGRGNNLGVLLGALLVPGFAEITRFLPMLGDPQSAAAAQWIGIGALMLVFLWFAPQGLIPERRRIFKPAPQPLTPAVQEPRGPLGGPAPAAEATTPLLSVRDLHREFGGVRAVDGASLEVAGHTITGLIGPNGAGKSTLLATVSGFGRPSAGSINFEGQEIGGLPPFRVARRGVIRTFQLSSEFGSLTALENLLVAARRQRGESLLGALAGKRYWWVRESELVERARSLLRLFAMAEKESDRARDLSGGQRRLLEIMRALMADPKLVLLDEPMAGVNPTLAGRIGDHLQDLRQEGLTMLLIEHELGIVQRICNPVVVMAQGRVIAQGAMEEVRTRPEVLDAYLVR